MTTNTFYKKTMVLFAVLLFAIVACKKEDPNKGLEPPRLFRPLGISVKTSQTTAKVTWSAPVLSVNLKLAYLTEFSQDSLFASSEFAIKTDTIGVTVTDEKLAVRKKYYVRVKALATANQPDSQWQVSGSFSITGEQLFLPLRELEIMENQVTLRWKDTVGLDKITLTPGSGTATSITLTPTESMAGKKVITGLKTGTEYSAEIFMGTKSKGLLKFSTLSATVYSVVLDPGADLVAAINAASNNAVIGLNPGTYSAGSSVFTLLQKSVTLKSTSGNPNDTKVNFKEFTLKGTGAGISLDGIELDGTASGSLYFINPTGVAADNEKANFANVKINNCIIHGATTSFLRANRGTAAGDYTMDQITVKNSTVYDIGSTLGYICFHLDKLQFNALTVTKSTFYNIGQAFLSCSTVIPGTPPVITVDYCTFNYFGANGRYVFMDANANPVRFSMTNSIIANVPRLTATVNNVTIRASAATSTIVFSYNNTFNFTNGTGTTLVQPTANTSQANNLFIALGWTATQTEFTLPLVSPLRTASSTGSPIGDPRWTY
ncbi:MAG: DUF4957 domain-containing protein [Candidatus Pedobacter colombiensis]|uniref:DUF4957 domain-containing protein n=1 Tax=Candidatus Pedobacter colombiensis TaxID=3121371 RepID=A0AAJ6B8I7_9SPHI|nr:DUF4957 domain-containing protein [Pedobacter sp.]WEK20929.1 MAG: DUF4957 domain-containing protein [Pedobacter sp.]